MLRPVKFIILKNTYLHGKCNMRVKVKIIITQKILKK